ncbi:hypothetical protein AVEN_216312-1 [Araneus ventricosus]|uniref:Uncharacterized protein n=1 Tax=Araneus ventricosus TaxID=182803 RepID=A0A4Y2Q4C8_ARAVE|nr:hypothetical protein AVEN_216312-1 [Araneus ventricosus]
MTSWVKGPLADMVRKFTKGAADQVSSSSSERCSKLQDLSQNNPRVDSKLAIGKNLDIRSDMEIEDCSLAEVVLHFFLIKSSVRIA